GIEGQGDAPVEAGGRAGDAEVFEDIVLEKAQYFVAAIGGGDEGRVLLDVINEPLLVVAEAEVVVLLVQFNYLTPGGIEGAVRAAVFVGEEGFFARGV